MNQLLAALLLAGGTAASAQTVLYDTFNEADQANLFDCCNALSFGGTHHADVTRIRIPFTVPDKTHITEIDLPVSFTEGRRIKLGVNLSGDHGHKHAFQTDDLVPAGQCCDFVSFAANVAVAPGGHYLLTVKAASRSADAWNLNSAGIVGTYEVSPDDGDTWTPVMGLMPAIRIIGE